MFKFNRKLSTDRSGPNGTPVEAPKDLKTSSWVMLWVPFALGTGLPEALAIAFIGATLDWRKSLSTIMRSPSIGRFSKIYVLLTVCFLSLYFTQSRLDLIPQGFGLSHYYFFKVVGASVIIVGLPLALQSPRDCLKLMGALALGAFARGALTVLLSFCYLTPPFHGNIFDIKTWAAGNSPSFANMLILSAVFYAAILSERKPLGMSIETTLGSIFVLLASVILGLFLETRLFNICILFVCPALYFFSNLLQSKFKPNYVLACILAGLFVASYLFLDGIGALQRPDGSGLNPAILKDVRFEMYKMFIRQMIENPFAYAQVGPSIIERTGVVQFHNFFADVQRISGTFSFLASIALLLTIIYFIFLIIKKRCFYGWLLLFIFIPILLVLNVSVEPEGGGQIYLMMLALGAAAAVILDQKPQVD